MVIEARVSSQDVFKVQLAYVEELHRARPQVETRRKMNE